MKVHKERALLGDTEKRAAIPAERNLHAGKNPTSEIAISGR
jgi:hypothetical protein